jgi:hypothetical protein
VLTNQKVRNKLEPLHFSEEQNAAYRTALAPPNSTDAQWNYFRTECERRALIPGVHVIFMLRAAQEWNKELQRNIDVQKVVLITTINALRLIAQRSGNFEGYGGPFIYVYSDENGNPTIESKIPLGKIPHGVSGTFWRKGWREPVFSFARFDANVQLKADKNPTRIWQVRGEEMTAKCMEAQGLRMICPEEAGSLYIVEEMGGDIPVEPEKPVQAVVSVAIPAATVAPAINQAAAVAEKPTVVVEKPTIAAEKPTEKPAEQKVVSQPTAEPPKAPAPVSVPETAIPEKATAAVPPKVVTKPGPPRLPARPATPRPVVPAVSVPTTVPPSAVVKLQESAKLSDLGLPETVEPVQESPAELAEVAARIARDEPGKKNLNGLAVTEADVPVEILDKEIPVNGKPAASTLPSAAVATEPLPTASAGGVGAAGAEPTADEYKAIMDRAAKIVRDKLEKQAGVKGAGPLMKDYLHKQTGQKLLRKIPKAQFEALIAALEATTPEQAAKMVTEGAK